MCQKRRHLQRATTHEKLKRVFKYTVRSNILQHHKWFNKFRVSSENRMTSPPPHVKSMGDVEKEAELLRAQTCFGIDLMKDGRGWHMMPKRYGTELKGRKVMAKIKRIFNKCKPINQKPFSFLTDFNGSLEVQCTGCRGSSRICGLEK